MISSGWYAPTGIYAECLITQTRYPPNVQLPQAITIKCPISQDRRPKISYPKNRIPQISYPKKLYTPNFISAKIVYPKFHIPKNRIPQISYPQKSYTRNFISPNLYTPNFISAKIVYPKLHIPKNRIPQISYPQIYLPEFLAADRNKKMYESLIQKLFWLLK